MPNKPLRKAVFPVAGLGTRFLPATKAMPKEMLTVFDRPLVQHVVDEARDAGIEHFIFVTGRGKAVIEDHFDHHPELESTLEAKGKSAPLKELTDLLPGAGQVSFTRQQRPLGLGHAVWCARDIVGDEPFAVLLPDVITKCAGRSCLAQMVETYNATGGNLLAVEQVPPEETHQYGIVSLGDAYDDGKSWPINAMVEKPPQGTAPSNLSIMGRYILQPEIFDILETQERGAGGEIQLTDGMDNLMKSQGFHAVEYEGRSFDCGQKLGFVTANVAFALDSPDTASDIRSHIEKLLAD